MTNDEGVYNQTVLAQESTPAPGQPEWYVVHSLPLKERPAAAALHERLGLTVYLPEVPQRFRGGMQPAPLFPRYLFIRANLGQVALSAINATPGVLRLVSFDERPQPVPPAVIQELQRRVELLHDAGGLPPHTFQPGEAVRLTGGPLCGLEAVFVGPLAPSERVRVLLEFMGRLNEVEVEAHLLEPAGNSPLAADLASVPAPKRERRTRGKGRGVRRTVS